MTGSALVLAACGGGGGGGSTTAGSSVQTQGATVGDNSVNRPPSISGSPAKAVNAGSAYYFRPQAIDIDDTALSFGIKNRPRWATFDSSNGRLFGTPAEKDVGDYRNILISVTDGQGSAELPAFSVTVSPDDGTGFTVRWLAPSLNSNGAILRDLVGYRVYMGTQSGTYSTIVDIDDPGRTAYSFEGMPPGEYFVTLTAVNGFGRESRPTREASIRF